MPSGINLQSLLELARVLSQAPGNMANTYAMSPPSKPGFEGFLQGTAKQLVGQFAPILPHHPAFNDNGPIPDPKTDPEGYARRMVMPIVGMMPGMPGEFPEPPGWAERRTRMQKFADLVGQTQPPEKTPGSTTPKTPGDMGVPPPPKPPKKPPTANSPGDFPNYDPPPGWPKSLPPYVFAFLNDLSHSYKGNKPNAALGLDAAAHKAAIEKQIKFQFTHLADSHNVPMADVAAAYRAVGLPVPDSAVLPGPLATGNPPTKPPTAQGGASGDQPYNPKFLAEIERLAYERNYAIKRTTSEYLAETALTGNTKGMSPAKLPYGGKADVGRILIDLWKNPEFRGETAEQRSAVPLLEAWKRGHARATDEAQAFQRTRDAKSATFAADATANIKLQNLTPQTAITTLYRHIPVAHRNTLNAQGKPYYADRAMIVDGYWEFLKRKADHGIFLTAAENEWMINLGKMHKVHGISPGLQKLIADTAKKEARHPLQGYSPEGMASGDIAIRDALRRAKDRRR